MQTEPPKAEPPKRKRRWFQFSLRTLLIGVALLAVACAHVAHEAKIVRERRNWLVAHLFAASSFPPHLILLAQGSAEHNPSVIRLLLGDNSYKFIPYRLPRQPR